MNTTIYNLYSFIHMYTVCFYLIRRISKYPLKITRLYTIHTFTVSNRDPFKKKKKLKAHLQANLLFSTALGFI